MKDLGIVPLRQGGVGTQMSPFGFIGLDDSPAQGQDFSPAVAPQEERLQQAQRTIERELAKTSQRAPVVPTAVASGVTPATVIKSARARIKELRAFLKEAKRAEKELLELERLISAAKKPLAPVRDIRRTAG